MAGSGSGSTWPVRSSNRTAAAITVESRVDEGSTFTVRLPRTLPRQTP